MGEGFFSMARAGYSANGASRVFHKHRASRNGIKVNGRRLHVNVTENNRSRTRVLNQGHKAIEFFPHEKIFYGNRFVGILFNQKGARVPARFQVFSRYNV